MSEVKQFYQLLYTGKQLEDVRIEDMVAELPTLSAEESNSMEGIISYEEATLALRNMKNNKSPGSDGFTVEFFKVFWQRLSCFVVRSLNEGFQKGELSTTQREGIIICIPKADKDRTYIKNWRPISLLNVVYKIGSSCIANRINLVLPTIINEDQTGFIRNRCISDNIRLILDLRSFVDTENVTELILCLDFEKAFDSVNWKCMHRHFALFILARTFVDGWKLSIKILNHLYQ